MALIMIALILSFTTGIHSYFTVEKIKTFIHSMGIWGPIAFILLYAVTSLFFFPASVLSTASGAIWGTYLGTFFTFFGAVLAAILPFFFARKLGRFFVKFMIKDTKLDICDRFISTHGIFSVLVLRLVPIVPWDVVNYGSGLCGISFRHYLIGTAIGTIPGSFTYNLIGSTIGQRFELWKVVLVTILVLALVIITAIVKRKFSKPQEKTPKK